MASSSSSAAAFTLLAAGATWIRGLPLSAWPGWTQAALVLWIALLGSAVGSFLNVVIYRSPRGMSLLHPGSHCPACQHPIRVRDNIPVLGWLLLRGACRDCGARISPRYPLVEALVAALFVGLSGLYLGLDGSTLPAPGADGVTAWGERRLTALCLFHLLLLTYLLAATAVQFDGQRVPHGLTLGVAAVGLVLPCIWPWLRPLESGISWLERPWLEAMLSGSVGAAVGFLVGFVRFALIIRSPAWGVSAERLPAFVEPLGRLSSPAQSALVYAVAGAFLGWQTVLIVGCVVAVGGVEIAAVGRRGVHVPDEALLLVAIVLVTATWKWVAEITMEEPVGWFLLAASPLLIVLFSVFQRRLLARNPPGEPVP